MPSRGQSGALFEELLDSAVEVGGLLIPGRSVQSHLGKFCLHLHVWTHDEIHKVRLIGTASPILYRGRYFLVCAKHQIDGVEPQDVGIMYPDGSRFVTSSRCRVFNEQGQNRESDAYDIVAFEFTEPVEEHPTLKPLFFNFSRVPQDVPSDHVLALVVAGFASADQVYELEEKNHLGSVKRNLTALPDGQPSDECLLRGRFVEKLGFDPDGLSGAPVFAVQFLPPNHPAAFFGGFVLRSGNETFHFLKSGFVKDFLDSFTE